jgi:signal transduction histidine kinase
MQALVFVACLVLVCAIGWLSHVKGPDLRLALYYPAPVLAVTWLVGRRAGYAMAVITTALWLVTEMNGSVRYRHPDFAVLNTAARLLTLTLAVFLLSSVKDFSNQLAEMVNQRTRSLRDLSIRLSQAEEFERSRIARDVHDGLGQSLTLLKLNLTAALADAGSGSVPARRLDDAVSLVSNLIERSRTLTFDLHPAMLDTLGLVPTLRHYAQQFGRQAQVEVTVNEEGQPTPLPAAMSSYLFRSTKELMTNAAKHGGAKQIIISVYWNPDRLRIVVDDDGSGFNPASILSGGLHSGIGLAGIRERITSLEGSLSIESAERSGSRIVLDLPSVHRSSDEES